MRKLLLAFAVFYIFPFTGFTQTDIWAEFDGTYSQKYDGLGTSRESYNLRTGSFRPFVGVGLGKSWSMGIMGDLFSYRDREDDVISFFPIYNPNPADPSNPEVLTYQRVPNAASKSNEYFSWGMFLRKNTRVGNRTSLSFTLFGLKGRGENGTFEVFPEYLYNGFTNFDCINCLTIIEGPLEYKFKEETWRFGLDLGFNWELNSWMNLGVKANILEFRKQILTSYPQVNNGFDLPQWPSSNSMDYGNRYDFGSAAVREGIRLSVNLRPFSQGKSEAQ